MDELRERLHTARLSNWEHWPTVRGLWPWFAALGLVILIAIPWGIRAEERNLETMSRDALNEAGIAFDDISFTGRRATIAADLSTNDQIAAVNVLAEVGGVSRVTWEEAVGGPVALPPPTTTVTTTTVVAEPGADLTAAVNDGKITLRGTVPTAQTIKDLSDAASDVWGSRVINQLFVDGSLLAHPWLGSADASIAVLSTLIDPQLSLDHEGATLTGGAVSQEALDDALLRLGEALGPEVAINNKVTVTPLELPNILIISPGDGTASITGKVASPSLRRSIGIAVAATSDEDLEVTSAVTTTDTTADLYLMQRIPGMVSVMGSAGQWTLQFDGKALAGVVVGGKTFTGNRVKATAQLAELLVELSSFLQADPNLVIELEVHADPREEGAEETALAQERADTIAAQLVRLGIDPARIAATAGPGEGELLRFMLKPAEK